MYRGVKGRTRIRRRKVPWNLFGGMECQFFGARPTPSASRTKPICAGERNISRGYSGIAGIIDQSLPRLEERYPVFAMYLTDNWRAFRTWGVSGISPWEYEHYWKLRDGVKRGREEFKVDWEKLQRPGFSPDYCELRYERMDLAYRREDWIATPAAAALLRNNQPLLAYLAGKPDHFTAKSQFLPGETVEKQLIVINDSRESTTCEIQWNSVLPTPATGTRRITVPAGRQERIPLRFDLRRAPSWAL